MLLALLFALVTFVLIIFAYELGGKASSTIGRILVMLGAGSFWGVIQFLTYFLFYWGILEMQSQSREATREESALSESMLPERDQYVLDSHQVAQLKLETISRQRQQKTLLGDLIVKACTKYRNNKSTSESLEVVTAQSRINLSQAESKQSMIRYALWAIPSIGFIGTVIGIANSLKLAADTSPEGIKKITAALNVAFDTTLVALILSIIGSLLFHLLQEKVENLHTNLESYVIENLVNRIYKDS